MAGGFSGVTWETPYPSVWRRAEHRWLKWFTASLKLSRPTCPVLRVRARCPGGGTSRVDSWGRQSYLGAAAKRPRVAASRRGRSASRSRIGLPERRGSGATTSVRRAGGKPAGITNTKKGTIASCAGTSARSTCAAHVGLKPTPGGRERTTAPIGDVHTQRGRRLEPLQGVGSFGHLDVREGNGDSTTATPPHLPFRSCTPIRWSTGRSLTGRARGFRTGIRGTGEGGTVKGEGSGRNAITS